MEEKIEENTALLSTTSDIVCTYISSYEMNPEDLPQFITSVYQTLQNVHTNTANKLDGLVEQQPAVPVEDSIQQNHIICLEDGKKLKMLKRYLRTNYNMSPEEYRARWNLPADYPMVAPSYAKTRSKLAKNIGLGKKAA